MPSSPAPVLELAFRPDRRAREPVYRQLAGYLRELVETGRLGPGQKLPATRELASALGLSRNTVNLAYESLTSARLLRAHVGQGTFVAPRRATRAPGRGSSASIGLAWEGLFARRPPELRRAEPGAAAAGPARFDLRGGRIDASALPRRDLRSALGRAVDEALPRIANRLDPQGYGPLREEIARALVARGIECAAADVLVVEGAQGGLDVAARVLLDAGDAAAVEEPGWFGARLAFAACGARVVPVPVDEEGLETAALERVLRSRRVKLVYATPAVQAPTGVTLAEDRRAELLALAEEHQCAVLEDDYQSELRLGAAPPALKRDDAGGRVLYLATFSKALFPALRLGYLVAAAPVVRRAAAVLAASRLGGNLLAQAALAELLRSGALERHVRRMRRLYAERLEAMLAALREHLPGARVAPPAGGTAVWVELPRDVDPDALAHAARAAGVAYTRGDAFHLEGGGDRFLYLGFAGLPPAEIAEAIGRIGECLRRQRARGGRE